MKRLALALVASILFLPAKAPADDVAVPSTDDAPREIGLVEKTRTRLAQLDVTVTGPPEAIGDLGADEFDLVVNGNVITGFTLDRICPSVEPPRPAAPAAEPEEGEGKRAEVGTIRLPVTYLFYFDQHHLTLAGRQTSIDTARDLVPRLIRDGNRGTIISSGEELRVFTELTDDPEELLEGLDRLEHDRRQWDPFPYEEDQRIAEVLRVLNEDHDLDRAIGVARRHARDERRRTDKALRLFSTVLARLADLDPPKAAIYFADTMRSNAGAHYLSFFGQAERRDNPALIAMELDAVGGANPFQSVIDAASANGVRLYTVQAQGLSLGESISITSKGIPRAGQSPVAQRVRIHDAQDSLTALANETGGEAFLNGVRPAKMAAAIEDDLDCLYLLSFDPTGLPLDEPLRIVVRVDRDGVEARTRGQLVVQSEGRRRTSRLLSAFSAPDQHADAGLRGIVIPTGFQDGKYSAMVQVALDGSPLSPSEWDIGASVVSEGEVRDDVSGRVSLGAPGVPIVLETSMSFSPGEYELIMVAHETHTDQISTAKATGSWPDPDAARATVLPLKLMQPEAGAYLRGDDVRRSGAIGRSLHEGVHTERDTALIGVVCRGRSRKAKLEVHRRLVGETIAEFPPLSPELDEDRCAAFRDIVPGGTLTEGEFKYEVHVLEGGEEIAAGDLGFVALDASSFAAAQSPS